MRRHSISIAGARTITWVAAIVAVCGLAAVLVATSSGFWSTGDAHGTGAAKATSLGQGPAPTVVSHGSRVVVTWGVATAGNGQAVQDYVVRRYDAGSGAPQITLAGCAGVVTANACTELGLPNGTWNYTVTPSMGAHWRGTESPHSGVVQTSPSTLELAKSVFGPPFPSTTSATLTGFLPNESLSYTVDGGPVVGSPVSVGADGAAAITAIAIPAGLGDGPHTIAVAGGNPATPSHAVASILVDTTPPTIAGFLTPAPNAAGWNDTSPVEVNGTADDGAGSGIAVVWFTADGSDPKTSPSRQPALAPPTAVASSTYKYYGVDLAGNESGVATLAVKIDTTPPGLSPVDLVALSGGAWIDFVNRRTYYRGADAGSFSYRVFVIDAGSGPASAADSPLTGDDVGFTTVSQTISTPAGGPYILNPISWVAGTTRTVVGTITLTDVAGNALVTAGDIVNDSATPSGGSVNATGLGGSDGRYSSSQDLHLTLAKGTDSGSGLADGSAATDLPARLMRASAPLTTTDGVANGTCGTYGVETQVSVADPPPTVTDTVPADAACYRYRYRVADHVGNVAAYASADIKVQTTATASLRPTAATLSAVSGVTAQWISGSTVFYNPARSGSFNVDSSTTSQYSGVAHMSFPAIAGFTGNGDVTSPLAGTTFRATYAWSANTAVPSPGTQSLSATNNAGQTATNSAAFSVAKDATGPAGGSVDAAGLGGTGGRYATSTTLSIVLAAGTDGGAGLAPSGAQLHRASAALTSDGAANGSCGVFGAYTQVGADDPPGTYSDTVPVGQSCYRYQYVVVDRVGNQTTYTSPDVKVDATAPPAPALSFSALTNAYWSGTGATVYYRPGASSGAFTVTAAAADTVSGIAAFAFPAVPALTGWTGAAAGSAARTYSWAAANPAAPTGALTVTATNNAGASSTAALTATADSTRPAGGSVTYPNATIATLSVSVSFAQGTDSGSGLAVASGVLQRASATLSGTTCGTYGSFGDVAANPTSPVSDPVAPGACYRYQYLISDHVGNQSLAFTSASVLKVVAAPFAHGLSIVAAPGAYFNPAAGLYYNANIAGSVRIVDAFTGGTGPASVTFGTIGLAGWTHPSELVSAPAGGPYTSSAFTWTAGASAGNLTVTGRDTSGATDAVNGPFISDVTAPSGGSIGYPGATVSTRSVAITTATGTDAGSGVDASSGIVRRDSTTLNTTTGVCGTFPATFATTVTLTGGADTSVVNGNCYQYRYLISDNVGNQRTYTSLNVVKLDTTPKVTAIASLQSNGTAGNGQLTTGDRLVLTFSEDLAPASVPATFSGATETRASSGAIVQLSIPGITNGALSTGSSAYLVATGAQTTTFGGTVALVNNGAATTLTITAGTPAGSATALGVGTLVFAPATTLTGVDGTGSAATFTTLSTFKLF